MLYIDGVPDATDFTYNRAPMDLDTTTIGGILRANPSHWFNGSIDDVRVYDTLLTAEEVAELAGTDPFECPADGDTHCADMIVEGPDGDGEGLYQLEVLGATDDSATPFSTRFVPRVTVEIFSSRAPARRPRRHSRSLRERGRSLVKSTT